jgi:hypothetical protein
MSLETAIQNLADAINALAATQIVSDRAEPVEPAKPRGRPRKVEDARRCCRCQGRGAHRGRQC